MNDLLSMYVGADSQHVLRMSFVPEQEAKNFDMEVRPFRHNSFNVTLPPCCSFCLSSLGVSVSAQLFSGMLLHHGALGNRSPKHSWPPLSPRTQTPFSTLHHNSEPNLFNFKPRPHCR